MTEELLMTALNSLGRTMMGFSMEKSGKLRCCWGLNRDLGSAVSDKEGGACTHGKNLYQPYHK